MIRRAGPGGDRPRRYFQLPPQPGQGIFAMDLFIRGDSAGPLKGDGRDFADPLRDPDLGLTDSRGIIIIDRETGRGVVIQSESCTVSVFGGDFCNEPRPFSINGDLGLIENDGENDATGEGINLDVTNNYDITPDGDGFRLEYESRNSVSPFPAISGDVKFQPGDDGALEMTEDDRDEFPAYQTCPDETSHDRTPVPAARRRLRRRRRTPCSHRDPAARRHARGQLPRPAAARRTCRTGYVLLLHGRSRIQLVRLEDGRAETLEAHALTPNERSEPGEPTLLQLGCGTGEPGTPTTLTYTVNATPYGFVADRDSVDPGGSARLGLVARGGTARFDEFAFWLGT